MRNPEETQERGGLRAIILDAARHIVERDGLAALSLSGVATEAGLARATVYGQFRGKDDLILSVIADDVGAVARAMRGALWPGNKEEAEKDTKMTDEIPATDANVMTFPAAAQPAQQPLLPMALPAATDTGARESAEACERPTAADAAPAAGGQAELNFDDSASSKPAGGRIARRADLALVLQKQAGPQPCETAGLQTRAPADAGEPQAQTEDAQAAAPGTSAPRAADAWLERRLRVFERALQKIEGRQDEAEQTQRAAISAIEENVRQIDARVDEKARQIDARMDASQAHGANGHSDLRNSLKEIVLRMQTLESVVQAALAGRGKLQDPAMQPVAEFSFAEPAASEEPWAATAPEPNEQGAEEPEAKPASDHDARPASSQAFIASARRSAIAAAAAVAAADKEKGRELFSRKRAIIAGSVCLVVTLIAARVAFEKGYYDGRGMIGVSSAAAADAVSLPSPHDRRSSARASTTRMALATPLDRLTASANGGNMTAELIVGLKYLQGDGTAKDEAAAARWIGRAAQQGNAVAQYTLATLYQNGIGVAKNPDEAFRLYEAAAMQGNRKAMHNLAVAYAQGIGTPSNLAESARWFSRAAQFGYVDSQFNLAVLYERGEGVPQSLLDAYKWYSIAMAQGDRDSAARVDILRTQLSADDIAAAEHAAAAFKPTPFDASVNTVPRETQIAGG